MLPERRYRRKQGWKRGILGVFCNKTGVKVQRYAKTGEISSYHILIGLYFRARKHKDVNKVLTI